VIALYTAKGIPMLWNGQEFGENWGVPNSGIGRNLFERPLHWEHFYDPAGKSLVRLHRIMGGLRRTLRSLKSRGYFYYYYDPDHLRQGVIAFRREAPATAAAPVESVLIFLNFSDRDASVWVPIPKAGNWRERIDDIHTIITTTQDNEWKAVPVPSNYGAVYVRQ
jgi:1,4-alpha-glucan branching enzyme